MSDLTPKLRELIATGAFRVMAIRNDPKESPPLVITLEEVEGEAPTAVLKLMEKFAIAMIDPYADGLRLEVGTEHFDRGFSLNAIYRVILLEEKNDE